MKLFVSFLFYYRLKLVLFIYHQYLQRIQLTSQLHLQALFQLIFNSNNSLNSKAKRMLGHVNPLHFVGWPVALILRKLQNGPRKIMSLHHLSIDHSLCISRKVMHRISHKRTKLITMLSFRPQTFTKQFNHRLQPRLTQDSNCRLITMLELNLR